jgi:hypothetical protein
MDTNHRENNFEMYQILIRALGREKLTRAGQGWEQWL